MVAEREVKTGEELCHLYALAPSSELLASGLRPMFVLGTDKDVFLLGVTVVRGVKGTPIRIHSCLCSPILRQTMF